MNTQNRHFLRRAFAAVMALVMLLGCAGCGGKEEKGISQTTSTEEQTSEPEPNEENTISIEEAEEEAYKIYMCSDPALVPSVSYEKFDEIMGGSYDITEKYLVDGYVPEDKIEDILQEKWAYMKQFVDNGTAVSVERTLFSCALTFANDFKIVYSVEFEGMLSGGGKDALQIISNIYLATDGLPDNAEKTAKLIDDSYSGYQLKESASYLAGLDSFSRLLDILEESSVLLFFGHGSDEGPSLSTTLRYKDVINDPRYDSEKGLSVTDAGMVRIDPTLIRNYFSDDSFQGAFVYLGACLTGSSDRLANAFLEKGAEVVLGNTSTVYPEEIVEYRHELIEFMCKGMSVNEAKGNVDAQLVSSAKYQEMLSAVRHVFSAYPSNEVIIFGNPGFVFSDEREYYLGRKYVISGTVRLDEDGRHYLELKSSVKIHGQNERCSRIYFYDEVDAVLAEYENKEESFKGTIMSENDMIYMGNDAGILCQDAYVGLVEDISISYETEYYPGKKYTFAGTIHTDREGHYYLELETPIKVRGESEMVTRFYFYEKTDVLLKEYEEKKGIFRGTIICADENNRLSFGNDLEVLSGGKLIKLTEKNESGSTDSDQSTAKTYDNLFDFLGESLDVVKQYYGEPNSDMGFDGNADCLTYEYGNYQIQFRSYGEKGVAEIDLRLEETSPEVKITPSVTTKMNHDEIGAGLPEFSCSTEANDYDNGEGMVYSTWLYGDSAKGNVSFHWSSTGFNKNDLTKGPCCVFLCKYQ